MGDIGINDGDVLANGMFIAPDIRYFSLVFLPSARHSGCAK